MNKVTLLLPNGLKVSVGDKIDNQEVMGFDDHRIRLLHIRKIGEQPTTGQPNDSFIPIDYWDKITSVQHRYDWVNALGENDFAFQGDNYYLVSCLNWVITTRTVYTDTNKIEDNSDIKHFSKQSDAERYLNKIKEKLDIIQSKKYSDNFFSIYNGNTEYPLESLKLREILISFAKEACKRQREICANSYDSFNHEEFIPQILNAPEPKME
jgi:hypothetical protein